MLKLYNTLSKKIEIFKPLKGKKVGLYSCGPTVYNYAHLGNLRAYIFIDLLKRYLKYRKYKVKHVMNITDVDDKTIRDSQKNNKTLKEFTNFYTKEFIKDIKNLNLEIPDVMPKATEHIKDMVALIKKLKKRNYTYKANNSIYFKISKFKNYGKLANLDKQELKENASKRLNIKDEYNKEEINDFVLWKAWQKSDGKVFWDTEIGKGRPGWHIECSAMSAKYLGQPFDIHTGGIDLVFPHHTNEIAQSEAGNNKKFVKYWLHNRHLIVDGKKMSKSLGNFYTLRDIINKKYNPLLLRLILLKTHYRKVLDFSFDDFKETKAIAERFIEFLINLDSVDKKNAFDNKEITNKIDKNKKEFQKAMDDDLNISKGMAVVFDFMGDINKILPKLNSTQAKEIKKYIFEIDSVFGFVKPLYENYTKRLKKEIKKTSIKKLLEKRAKARSKKDYETADKIRRELLKKGIIIEDKKNKYNLKLTKLVL